MNVSTHNNIAMMSSMVGVPQQTGQTKQVANKDLDQGKQVSEADKAEEAAEHSKDKNETAAANAGAGKAEHSSARQQARSVQRRYVAEDYKQEKAESKTENSSELDQPGQTQGTGKGKGVMLDTSSGIQLKFNKFVAQQQTEASQQTRMKPDIQRRQFASNLQKWVDVEYKQFVKSNDPLYTRRNLREILSALGDQDPSVKKNRFDKDSVGKNSIAFSKYNKHNITQASKAMRIFEEIPSNLDNMDYDLVA